MEKFSVNERVVVTFDDGSTSIGKVLAPTGDNTYLVKYTGNDGWQSGEFCASQLTSVGVAMCLATEYEAVLAELEEVSDLC